MTPRIHIFILGLLLLALKTFGQPAYPGHVVITQDPRVERLLEKHKAFGEKGQEGYRVQIFFDSGNNSKNRATAKKGQFIARYPEVGAYLTFDSPNYKVRVGDFRTRMDAEGFKSRILGEFPDVFVVRDEINYPEL